MPLRDLHPLLLRTFLVVVSTGSFNAAAVAEFTSSESVSLRITQLERAVGTALIERGGSRLTPTAAGQELFQQAPSFLDSLEKLRGAAASAGTADYPTIRLGVAGSRFTVISDIVAEAARAQPPIRLEVVGMDILGLQNCLGDGRVDAAVLDLPLDARRLSQIRYLPLSITSRTLLVPAQHALADRSRVRVTALAGERLCSLPDGVDDIWERFWSVADERAVLGVTVGKGPAVASIEETTAAVAAGECLAICTSEIVSLYPEHQIVAVPIDDVAQGAKIVAWRRDLPRPAVEAMASVLIRYLVPLALDNMPR